MDRVILDSNVILKHIFGERDISPVWQVAVVHYNPIIHSEVLYVLLLNETGQRPYSLKKEPPLVKEAAKQILPLMKIFEQMIFVPTDAEIHRLAERYVGEYGLLPGDAIILATAVRTNLDYLITEDADLLRLKKVEGCKTVDLQTYLHQIGTQ